MIATGKMHIVVDLQGGEDILCAINLAMDHLATILQGPMPDPMRASIDAQRARLAKHRACLVAMFYYSPTTGVQ